MSRYEVPQGFEGSFFCIAQGLGSDILTLKSKLSIRFLQRIIPYCSYIYIYIPHIISPNPGFDLSAAPNSRLQRLHQETLLHALPERLGFRV